MLKQLSFNICMHRIKNKIDTLSPRQLRRRNKIRIPRKQDYAIYESFESKRCNINTDFHVNTFLSHLEKDVALSEFFHLFLSREELLYGIGSYSPCLIIFEHTDAKRNLTLLLQSLNQL